MKMKRRFAVLLLVALIGFGVEGVRADDGMTVIRDAEIEQYVRDLAAPVLKAADIPSESVRFILVKNNTLNAFVAGGMNIFLFTGLLTAADTPEQLLGVIAHETGHMAGGHLVRGTEAMKEASAQAIIGMVLGAAAGIATGNGEIALGAITGAQSLAERNFLSYSRMQESSADSAAMTYLDSAGVSSEGLLAFMKKLVAQDILPIDRKVAYARTHPLSQDRVDFVAHHTEKSPYTLHTLAPKLARRHARMKAKLVGFLQPESALLRYADKDKRWDARYARAIALYRTNQVPRALDLIRGLRQETPDDPYLLELEAQILFESGKPDEAVPLYDKSVRIVPGSAILHQALAHALLEGKDKTTEMAERAANHLLAADRLEPGDADTWRFLAISWGRIAEASGKTEDKALVFYARAEEALAQNASKEARFYADKALDGLPKDSPYRLRAEDIKHSVKRPENEKGRPPREGSPGLKIKSQID